MRLFALLLIVATHAGQMTPADPLTQARQRYNAREFDEAIRFGEEARRDPALRNAACVVVARARIERFRQTSEPEDLAAAREALLAVDATKLQPRDHVEYLVGQGEALYFGDPPRFSAAAEFFETALARSSAADAGEREMIFEWWAGALDRQAQIGPETERKFIYSRLLAGAEEERRRNDMSAVAWFWLAVAARGVDDLERAWGAAQAGWIRGAQLGARGVALRADLDRFVMQVVLPERAKQLMPGGDPREALPGLQQQWLDLKKLWGGGGDGRVQFASPGIKSAASRAALPATCLA